MSTPQQQALRAETPRPAKQARGRRTRARLLAAGLALLHDRDLDQIGIAELATAAHSSIGAFYHHFGDKDGFYTALVDQVVAAEAARVEAALAPAAARRLGTRELLHHAMALLRGATRDNQGLIRTVLKRSMAEPEAWAPVRSFVQLFSARLEAELAGRTGDFGRDDWREALAFGLQMAYSTVFNAIVNRPGPLQIDDERMVDELAAMLGRQLEVGRDD